MKAYLDYLNFCCCIIQNISCSYMISSICKDIQSMKRCVKVNIIQPKESIKNHVTPCSYRWPSWKICSVWIDIIFKTKKWRPHLSKLTKKVTLIDYFMQIWNVHRNFTLSPICKGDQEDDNKTNYWTFNCQRVDDKPSYSSSAIVGSVWWRPDLLFEFSLWGSQVLILQSQDTKFRARSVRGRRHRRLKTWLAIATNWGPFT